LIAVALSSSLIEVHVALAKPSIENSTLSPIADFKLVQEPFLSKRQQLPMHLMRTMKHHLIANIHNHVDKIVHSENNGLKGGNNNIVPPATNLLFEPSDIDN
jgi:hypothetical protein